MNLDGAPFDAAKPETLRSDFDAAIAAIKAEPTFGRPMATVHHPNCPCAQPIFVTASWARSPTLADCTCGGTAFPTVIR